MVVFGLFLFRNVNAQESVKDRITLAEALEQNVMTSAQYDLATCAHYTHATAIFRYDHSVKPKLTGVARRISENDPYTWEEISISSLSCGEDKKLKHPNALKALDAALAE
jgi:hypothetical protein